MRVVVAGSSGLIGTALVAHLRAGGHEVLRLVRRSPAAPDERGWDPPAGTVDPGTFEGVDAVVNLGGAGIADRPWSGARRQALRDSRVVPTEVLAAAVAEHGVPTLLSASAVGYYGDGGSAVIDESAPPGTGFLAGVTRDWEAATQAARDAGVRVVLLRTGLVLSPSGGLLGPLKLVYKFGVGGRIGSGTQYMPWISLDDEVGAMGFLLEDASVDGPVNLTGPAPVTNAEFTAALAHAVHRPALIPVPAFAIRALGAQGEELLLYGQRAVPAKLEAAGYRFRHATLDDALAGALGAPEVSHDVVVVGAGLAGLRAAAVLCRRGLDVVVLEAADRPGGRVATDVVDGFRCDRGFQVLNTSYPALRAATDLAALDLRSFAPAAAVCDRDGALHTYGDPRRRPGLLPRAVVDPLVPMGGKLALVTWTARVLAAGPRRVSTQGWRSAAEDLAAHGVTGPVLDRVLRPFLSGVLGEAELTTSAAFVRLLWRAFAIGTIAVPGAGMGVLPAQLAAGLPDGVVRYGRRVEAVAPGAVRADGEEIAARAVVVAADPVTAAALLPGLPTPRMHALTTVYHVAAVTPARGPTLHIDGTGGPLANTVVLTEAAPRYSPDRRALVSSSFLGTAERVPEPTVRRELARLYGEPTDDWTHLHTAEIAHALPALPAGTPLRRDVALGDGLFVAGDHRDTPSQQGALVSGRRAAQAVLAHLGTAS